MPLPLLGALLPAILGGAAGAAKTAFIDAPREGRERELAARTQELSPWTGLQAQAVTPADPFGAVAGGALAGQSFAKDNADLFKAPEQLEKERLELMKRPVQNFVFGK